jgi:phosphoribosylaminoimidazolecarboxamide formyltransferase/IMP cyclohydrolase
MRPIKTALISVFDKTGVAALASELKRFDVRILSTGGTARLLRQSGVDVEDISDYTGFPEMMDGRVKTLHPRVHGGLLGLRDNPEHVRAMTEHGILPIDMVVVNLYPFEATIQRPGVQLAEVIENIDIGGPSMLRSAAKNARDVVVVVKPERYAQVVQEMKSSGGGVSEDLRRRLMVEAFQATAAYDTAIAAYFAGLLEEGQLPSQLRLAFDKRQDLRYGENPHQRAAFYVARGCAEPSVATARQVHGKELSFNNILDANGALELVKEFTRPTVAIIKHTNPCGVAVDDRLAEAYRKAYLGDPLSAFGGIIAANRPIDRETAENIADTFARFGKPLGMSGFFAEVILAPDYDAEALKVLTSRKGWGADVRLLKTGPLDAARDAHELDVRRVVGGLLVQSRDLVAFEPEAVQCVTEKRPTEKQSDDLALAWTVAKHVKSNAIVLAQDEMVVGVGAGQMSRVDSAMIAAKKAGERAKGAVLASDAFFPFPDTVEQAAAMGAVAIIQPGGSKGDPEVIAAANRLGLAMLFTGKRHFKH